MKNNVEYQIAVHIDIPEPFARAIQELKAELNITYPGHEIITPHITLHLSCFPKHNFSAVCNLPAHLQGLSFELTMGSIAHMLNKNTKKEFFYITVHTSDQLYELHKTVVAAINKLRDGLIREKDVQRMSEGTYSPEEKQYITEYGYLRVMKYFNPHITLGEVGQKMTRDTEKALARKSKLFAEKHFMVGQIVLGLYTYDNGQQSFVGEPVERIITLKT